MRLSPDGPSVREGRVEMCYQNTWGAVYDENWSQFDAAVVCAQLNFSRIGRKLYQLFILYALSSYPVQLSLYTGALPISGVLYRGSTDRVPFVYASPNCVGNETTLLNCSTSIPHQLGQTGFYQDQSNGLGNNFVGVKCEGEGSTLWDSRN